MPDTILVLNLQKSQWGDTLYVNAGVYVRALGSEHSPPHNRCHINARLERVVPAIYFEPIRCLTASEPPSAEALEAFVSHGLPWLESVSTATGISTFLSTAFSRSVLVFAQVRDWAEAECLPKS